jgi:hypothetical protein
MNQVKGVVRATDSASIANAPDADPPEGNQDQPTSQDWPIVAAAVLLPICCLAPVLLVSFGAWFAALEFEVMGPLALAIAGVLLGAGLIAFRLHRARGAGKADLKVSRDICGR